MDPPSRLQPTAGQAERAQVWGIGATAKRFALSPSTLRYYEHRGLIRPQRGEGGQRRYDREQLRRIAFLRLGAQLGISLEVIAGVLDEPRGRWLDRLRDEQAGLRQLIDTARNAAAMLEAAANCRHDHPGQSCPELRSALDAMIDGASLHDIAARYG